MNKVNEGPKIAIIGPYPPPYGGIAIHIQRLKKRLEEEGYKPIIYELGRQEQNNDGIVSPQSVNRWLLSYFFFSKEDIIHFHNPDWRMRVVIGMMGLVGKKTVISIHGSSLHDSLKNGHWIKRQIIKLALKYTPFIIALNSEIKKLIISLGINPERVAVIPSFIPPILKEEDISKVPQEVWDFIDSHNPVISANAFRISFYNNQDLYGIDMCIDLCANLKRDYPKIGFVFCLPDVGDYEYFSEMKQRIKESEIEENFFFQTKPCQFYPILMKSDLFVRPTNTDGYGISIAEAIYLKVPAIASDVCSRAEGTIIFKSRDIDDFILKVKDVLDNYEEHKERLKGVILEDNAEKIIKIYQNLCK
jgi:glycosyltransferase involved in cell wall biosynthesis